MSAISAMKNSPGPDISSRFVAVIPPPAVFATPTAQIVWSSFLTLFADAIPCSTSSRFSPVRRIRVTVPRGRVPVGDEHHQVRTRSRSPATSRRPSSCHPPRCLYTASIVRLERLHVSLRAQRHERVAGYTVASAAKLKIFICDGVTASALTKLFAVFVYAVLFGVIEPDRSSTIEIVQPARPPCNAGFVLRFTNRRVGAFALLTETCPLYGCERTLTERIPSVARYSESC